MLALSKICTSNMKSGYYFSMLEHCFLRAKVRRVNLDSTSFHIEIDNEDLLPDNYLHESEALLKQWSDLLKNTSLKKKSTASLIKKRNQLEKDQFLREALKFELGNYLVSVNRVPDFLNAWQSVQRRGKKRLFESDKLLKELKGIGISEYSIFVVEAEIDALHSITRLSMFRGPGPLQLKKLPPEEHRHASLHRAFKDAISKKIKLVFTGEGLYQAPKSTNIESWHLHRIKRLLEIGLKMNVGTLQLMLPLVKLIVPKINSEASHFGKFREPYLNASIADNYFNNDYREICWRVSNTRNLSSRFKPTKSFNRIKKHLDSVKNQPQILLG